MNPSSACPNFHRTMTRRHALKVGGLGLLGLNLPRSLQAEALASAAKIKPRAISGKTSLTKSRKLSGFFNDSR